jgi:hypothetical protein
MKSISRTYLHHREVSAQEAVYRACGMQLKHASRKVTFVPTGDNITRISKPLSQLESCGEFDSLWMTSLNDRYKSRPLDQEFIGMCLASFASDYNILYGKNATDSDKNRVNPAIVLQNNMGVVQKRSRSDPSVIRYARFSEKQFPEKHCQSMLELFLPHRAASDLLPPPYESHEAFYQHGQVLVNDELQTVKGIVNGNKHRFEINGNAMEDVENEIRSHGVYEDAWAQLCPQAEQDRMEHINSDDDDDDEGEILFKQKDKIVFIVYPMPCIHYASPCHLCIHYALSTIHHKDTMLCRPYVSPYQNMLYKFCHVHTRLVPALCVDVPVDIMLCRCYAVQIL